MALHLAGKNTLSHYAFWSYSSRFGWVYETVSSIWRMMMRIFSSVIWDFGKNEKRADMGLPSVIQARFCQMLTFQPDDLWLTCFHREEALALTTNSTHCWWYMREVSRSEGVTFPNDSLGNFVDSELRNGWCEGEVPRKTNKSANTQPWKETLPIPNGHFGLSSACPPALGQKWGRKIAPHPTNIMHNDWGRWMKYFNISHCWTHSPLPRPPLKIFSPSRTNNNLHNISGIDYWCWKFMCLFASISLSLSLEWLDMVHGMVAQKLNPRVAFNVFVIRDISIIAMSSPLFCRQERLLDELLLMIKCRFRATTSIHRGPELTLEGLVDFLD